MKAVIQTGGTPTWAHNLGLEAWILAPIAGRPLLEYWLELCDVLRITEVRLVLSDGAQAVESFAQDGARWGLQISYSFVGPNENPDQFLTRSPELWNAGLFYVSTVLFPRRLAEKPLSKINVTDSYLQRVGGRTACLLSTQPEFLTTFINGNELPLGARPIAELGFEPAPIAQLKDFYELNLRMVRGESARYVSHGYFFKDGASIGYNVIIPPAASLQPPLVIGNDTRLSALTHIGPDVIIGHRCIVDRQSYLARCVILDGTYIGRNLEICDKIVAGSRLIDPTDGTVADLEDSWLLSSVHSALRPTDILRALLGWPLTLLLVLLQLVPFLLLISLSRFCGNLHAMRREVHATRRRKIRLLTLPNFWGSRLFRALSVDLFPALVQVLAGRLWLCGQEPLTTDTDDTLHRELKEYFPAVFTYATPRAERSDTFIKRVDALYYAHNRSLAEDMRILCRALFGRLASLFASSPEQSSS